MISDKAVEVALDAYLEYRATRGPGNALNMMREALEAAAPHMLAGAKVEAWCEGEQAGAMNHAAEEYPELPTITNPYRSQA